MSARERQAASLSSASSARHHTPRAAAFSSAALLLYVPANIFPILAMGLYGVHSESTVSEGCETLFQRTASSTYPRLDF